MITNRSPIATFPPWAEWFATDDLDELHSFVARSVGDHSRVAIGPGSLGFEQGWVDAATVAVGWVRTGLRSVVRGAVPDPVFHVSVPLGASYRFGRRSHSVDARSVTVIAPGWEYMLDRPGGPCLAVRVAGRRLAAAGGAGEVTTVALSLGFSHVGRFGTLCRRAYGESPSQTVRRAGR